jgi:hypothetical protein
MKLVQSITYLVSNNCITFCIFVVLTLILFVFPTVYIVVPLYFPFVIARTFLNLLEVH